MKANRMAAGKATVSRRCLNRCEDQSSRKNGDNGDRKTSGHYRHFHSQYPGRMAAAHNIGPVHRPVQGRKGCA